MFQLSILMPEVNAYLVGPNDERKLFESIADININNYLTFY